MATDLGTLAGNALQTSADLSLSGTAGDWLRGYVDLEQDGIADNLLPSNARGAQTLRDAAALAETVAIYAQERWNNPQLLQGDLLNFVQNNWNEVRNEYTRARTSPNAEFEIGRFFTRYAGRIAFEAITTIVPVGAAVNTVRRLGTVGGVVVDAATGANRLGNATDPTQPGANPRPYGSSEITIDTRRLQAEIEAGTVSDVQIIPPAQVREVLEGRLETARRRAEAHIRWVNIHLSP